MSTLEDTMGHAFLRKGDFGAVAVLGAGTLTEARAEREMSTLLYGYLLSPGTTLGEAVLQSKRDYAELVSRSVARQAKGRRDIGVMMSVGLNSVPAAWGLHHHQGSERRLAAYSWSLSRFPESNETGLIRKSAALIGIPAHVTKGDELWPLCAPDELPLCPEYHHVPKPSIAAMWAASRVNWNSRHRQRELRDFPGTAHSGRSPRRCWAGAADRVFRTTRRRL